MATDLKNATLEFLRANSGHATPADLEAMTREDLIERAMVLQDNIELLSVGIVAVHGANHGCVLCSMLEEAPDLAGMIGARAAWGLVRKEELSREMENEPEEEESDES